jgi:hypothetical protein
MLSFTFKIFIEIIISDIMFVGKSLPYSGAPKRCFTRVGSGLPRKLRLGLKRVPGVNAVITKIRKLRTSFITLAFERYEENEVL